MSKMYTSEDSIALPYRQIRAVYNQRTIRVYQAYSNAIADTALQYGRFVSPPFNMERMTWIKPSFLWMMYRAGWGKKEANQKRLLAIDITRTGFEWALSCAYLAHYESSMPCSYEQWQQQTARSNVLMQWDPERDIHLHPLSYRTIQIGLRDEALRRYVYDWIESITDITWLANTIYGYLDKGDIETALNMLPEEQEYILNEETQRRIGI